MNSGTATISGSCHCGAVTFDYPGPPERLTSCNCSICRRLATLWAYAPRNEVNLVATDGATIAYVHGDKTLEIHSCKTCGCTTHWVSIDGDETSRMAVNFRLCEPEAIDETRIRHLDGADSWEFLD